MMQPRRRNNNDYDSLIKSQQVLALRQIYAIGNQTNLLRHQRILGSGGSKRTFVGFVLRHALKLRYWVATGIFGGSIAASNWYDEWKRNLPDFGLPEWAKFDENPFLKISSRYDDLKSKWAQRDMAHLNEWKNKLSNLEIQWKTAETSNNDEGQILWLGSNGYNWYSTTGTTTASDVEQNSTKGNSLLSIFASKFSSTKDESDHEYKNLSEAEIIQRMQDDMMKSQMQYQREIERLEKEVKNLKTRLLLKDSGEQRRLRKVKRSLIDMYSEMLDLLNEYDSSYNITDNLPRVVVVGDQSAGKTSVLEMIAQARIFPRGSGEMMTRAPVKVTLSEGPYHVAQFRDSSREFDLTNESDLEQLRNEIELRMRNSVANGKTVSNEVIALTVKGPSLPRMVLVDLPGVISTVTTGMARETKEDITKMVRNHMENPNSIILCIQDGSIDAERSNVTDLVSKVDPNGQRTILVLTKVDLAEKNLSNPHRIRRILEGKLFPMKAIGYFGVVTGKGTHNDSIEDIRRYEEEFFENSKLFKDGVLKPSQMTTRNMSMAVSEVFWRMVRDTIESQADAFKATRFNLEAEWKNTFPKMRELDRDELFDKARSEVLDECVNVSLINAEDWELELKDRLWKTIAPYIFESILLPAFNLDNIGSFNTMIDIRLKQWIDTGLANKAVGVGWQTLSEAYKKQFEQNIESRDHDPIFDKLKEAVLDAALLEHKWDKKALDYLRVIQINAMEDRMVPDKRAWESACNFFSKAVDHRLAEIEQQLREARGPGMLSRWVRWLHQTPENAINEGIQNQLRLVLLDNPDHKSELLNDDITVVKRALEATGTKDLSTDVIREQWLMIYRSHFLNRLQQTIRDCYPFFQNYKMGNVSDFEIDCHSIVLFYRLQKMVELSCNALRQQITNTEQRRLEKEIKEVLDDWSQEATKKKELLIGRRVDLAEELKQVRYIQEKLEEFMNRLHHEKS